MKMNNHELVEFIQQREQEIQGVISDLQRVRDMLNDARAKSEIESEERRIRLNTLRAKAGLPVKPRPIITLTHITEGE
jgi:hypothetical protein